MCNEIVVINPIRLNCKWQNPEDIAYKLIEEWGESGFIWLDGDNSPLSRWITIATNPIEYVCCKGLPSNKNTLNPFDVLRNLKPGHWTGWLSYEAGAWVEPSNPWKEDSIATLWMASHDPILKFDLTNRELWIEGSQESSCKEIAQWLERVKSQGVSKRQSSINLSIDSWEWITDKSNFSKKVNTIKKFIENGDIFQANLSICCTNNMPTGINALNIFSRLRNHSPAPFAGLIIGSGEAQGEAIISSSPERFLKILPDGIIETRPIKGTRPRHLDHIKDADLAVDLICSDKDRAENLMIVDLLRNDLGKVCEIGSINVPTLISLESYPKVHHLTSVIRGKLLSDKSWVDALEACWPGGSITGAPKVRACKRIYELEQSARGPYCGSILNVGWNGVFDSNILIRSLIVNDKILRAHAGCGIVADSDPIKEADELLWKLTPLFEAIQ